jgi:hypothetical protein
MAADSNHESRGHDPRGAVLHGSLQVFSCWEVLQWMAQRAGEGTLRLTLRDRDRRARAWLHLQEGTLVALSLRNGGVPGGREHQGPAPYEPAPGRLGGWLVGRGRIDTPRLRFALGLQGIMAGEGRRPLLLGQILCQCGYLESAELTEALRGLAREALADVLRWKEGTFRFRCARPIGPGLPVGERIEPLLLQLSHAMDGGAGIPSSQPMPPELMI